MEETEHVVELTEDEWRETDAALEMVIRAAMSGDLAIVVGAGVSKSAGLPDWTHLVADLLNINIPIKVEDLPPSLTRDKIVEAYLAAGSDERISVVTEAALNTDAVLSEESLRRALYAEGRTTSELVSAIGKLIGLGRSYGRSPIVMTLNYDDVLERQLASEFPDTDFQPVYSAQDSIGAGTVPIYHLHGYIPQGIGGSGDIILDERGYMRRANDPGNWASNFLEYHLRHSTCYFVGTSMEDPNIRSSLHRAKDSSKLHYWTVRIDGGEDVYTTLDDSTEGLDSDRLQHLTSQICRRRRNNIKNTYQHLKVASAWYEAHEELPQLIVEAIERNG